MKRTREGYRNAERVMKGVANHRRAEILVMLKNFPEKSVSEIAEVLKIDYRTASEHIHKLTRAGLVMKRSDGTSVRQALTKLGEHMLDFLSTIAND